MKGFFMNRLLRKFLPGFYCLALFVATTAKANNVTVVNNNDNGSGSLRAALGLVNQVTGGTINFAPTVTGTITLTSGPLYINTNTTIVGPGVSLLIINGNSSQAFNIGSGVTVNISGLTIANGNGTDGGAIYNDGTLTVTACTFSNNLGTNGGAIDNDGTLTVTSCTFGGNSGGIGGAIYNDISSVGTLTACTFNGNHAVIAGGAIASIGPLTVTSCTISGNAVQKNGGGLSLFAAIVRDCIIAGNSAAFAPDVSGIVTSQGYNLIGAQDGSSGWGANDPLVGTSYALLLPLLGPLAPNGGPTDTMALESGSPAINQGKSFGLTTDQRGYPRPGNVNVKTPLPVATGAILARTSCNRQCRPTPLLSLLPPCVISLVAAIACSSHPLGSPRSFCRARAILARARTHGSTSGGVSSAPVPSWHSISLTAPT